jgi:hypothetical protein
MAIYLMIILVIVAIIFVLKTKYALWKKLLLIFICFVVASLFTFSLFIWGFGALTKMDRDNMQNNIETSDTLQSYIQEANTIDTPIVNHIQVPQTKLSVLVLPPYDELANGGFSPNIQKQIETEIAKDSSLTVIKFPYKQLMKVPYQQVFDKKYCKPITNIIKTDIIVMSKLDNVKKTGYVTSDKWNVRIKIYNTNTDNQINSNLKANNLTDYEIKQFITYKQKELVSEINNIH